MKAQRLITGIILAISFFGFRMDKPAYVIFNREGKDLKFRQMIDKLSDSDIILFGEIHNSPIAHWMELSVAKELFSKNKPMTLGAEMFEADNQLTLDEYISGQIQTSNFEKETRLWDNYKTDYKPLVEFAKEKKIRMVATNVPRRYASIVSKKGFAGLDSLSPGAKEFMAPLPINYDPELPGYKKMREMMGTSHSQAGAPSNPDFFSQAQDLKDATMAFFILKNFHNGQYFIHFNGSYHSNNFDGIVWHIKKSNPDLRISTINVVEQDDPETLMEENRNSADFIITTPSDMTKTY
jgi:uncharacterized iron-regulated protein